MPKIFIEFVELLGSEGRFVERVDCAVVNIADSNSDV
jgi:hypothetical protein